MTQANDGGFPSDDMVAGWQADDMCNRDLYRTLVTEHGLSFRALNWGSAAGQRTRFEILCGIGIVPDASVLDVGCGTGELCVFLRQRGFTGRYVGVDITPEMVEAARTRGLDTEFYVADLLALESDQLRPLHCDYVLSSGIFYYRQHAPQRFLEVMTRRFLELARVGVAFNSLSTWADQQAAADEFRADPASILAHCRTLTPWVSLRHDYHPGDFTIYMQRGPFLAAASVAERPS